ncbi:uncharacterized protein At2g39920 isoform X2 [Coffea eugenioides]|uniref:Uncharacterized protein At2g39920-like isoform X4 n=1 Tax=Coffea arabica TaxID=13443 RepID=A0ABM4WRY6_COFAR|nr:uncharacterized protein At2g39920 isoform X2 [Coffea eugenioides]
MSAYGHQMEREYSAQSLLRRSASESESHYTMETGIYMSSFAATVFVAGLVTVGVSLMTLLIALTVMLQNCQRQNAGVVEMQKPSDDYEFCRILALHIEINHLDSDSFPLVCKELAFQFIGDGQYIRELNATLRVVENYFSSIRPGEDGRDVVLMDADDLLPSDYDSLDQFNEYNCSNCHKDARQLKWILVRELYVKLQNGGWPMILLSRKPERLRKTTVGYLNSVGCGGWSSLIMREDNEFDMDNEEYLTRRRTVIKGQGLRTVAAISSQLDFLTGSKTGGLSFKIPNVFTDKMNNHPENPDSLKSQIGLNLPRKRVLYS